VDHEESTCACNLCRQARSQAAKPSGTPEPRPTAWRHRRTSTHERLRHHSWVAMPGVRCL